MRSRYGVFLLTLPSALTWAQVAPPPNYDQKLSDVGVTATRAGTFFCILYTNLDIKSQYLSI